MSSAGGRLWRSSAGRQQASAPRHMGRFLLPALLGLYVVLSVLLFDPKLTTAGDNARYLMLGKSLAEGKGYRDLYLPDAPAHTQYPPGFPLILAAITILCGGVNVLAAKLFVLLTGIGAMFFIYRLCQLTFREKAWPAMVLFASAPALVVNNHWILSEMPFLLATVAALYCLVLADQRPRATAARLQVGACGLAVAAYFIRTAGLAVVLGMVLLFLVRRQYRNLTILLLLFAATAVLWQVRSARVGHSQPYLVQLLAKNPYYLGQGRAGIADWALRVWQNLRDYVALVIPRTIFPTSAGSWFEKFSGIILSLLTAIGFYRGFRKHGALASSALFAGPLLVCWPHVWLSDRFLLPFLPLVVIFLFYGVDWLGVKLGWRRFALAFVGALVLANAVQMTLLARKAVSDNLGYLRGDRYSGYSMDWRHYFEVIERIRVKAPEDAVVLARKPEFVCLLSGRRSYCYPFSNDRGEAISAITHSQYVIVDMFEWTKRTALLVGTVLLDNPDRWELVYATPPPRFYVVKIRSEAQAPAASADQPPTQEQAGVLPVPHAASPVAIARRGHDSTGRPVASSPY